MIDAEARVRISNHPLLYQLTDLQLDALGAVLYGHPPDPAAHLPEVGEIWCGRSPENHLHTVEVVGVDLATTPRLSGVRYITLTGGDGEVWDSHPAHSRGPWHSTLTDFLTTRKLRYPNRGDND